MFGEARGEECAEVTAIRTQDPVLSFNVFEAVQSIASSDNVS